MGLIKTAIIGGLGYLGYKQYQKSKGGHAAYDNKQPDNPGMDVRGAGRGAMRDQPDTWSKAGEDLDEGFPASDPATKY